MVAGARFGNYLPPSPVGCVGSDGNRNPGAVSRRLINEIKEKFELVPQVAVLETGTLAKEFEANVTAARFVDRRG